jgi:hypothetical protein
VRVLQDLALVALPVGVAGLPKPPGLSLIALFAAQPLANLSGLAVLGLGLLIKPFEGQVKGSSGVAFRFLGPMLLAIVHHRRADILGIQRCHRVEPRLEVWELHRSEDSLLRSREGTNCCLGDNPKRALGANE